MARSGCGSVVGGRLGMHGIAAEDGGTASPGLSGSLRRACAGEAPIMVTIVIKALNEEARIARAIASALDALAASAQAGLGAGEVVLADSRSSDRTVEIASGFPIRIARLADGVRRSCGIGPQLGYQYARGRFVCLIDGDMALDPGFLP